MVEYRRATWAAPFHLRVEAVICETRRPIAAVNWLLDWIEFQLPTQRSKILITNLEFERKVNVLVLL